MKAADVYYSAPGDTDADRRRWLELRPTLQTSVSTRPTMRSNWTYEWYVRVDVEVTRPREVRPGVTCGCDRLGRAFREQFVVVDGVGPGPFPSALVEDLLAECWQELREFPAWLDLLGGDTGYHAHLLAQFPPAPAGEIARGRDAALFLHGLSAKTHSRVVIIPRDQDDEPLGLVLATADRELVEGLREFLDQVDVANDDRDGPRWDVPCDDADCALFSGHGGDHAAGDGTRFWPREF